jgi:small subunit ribosomal protein S1
MTNESLPESQSAAAIPSEPKVDPIEESTESFADLLSAFERSHSHKAEPGSRQLEGTVVSVSADQVFLDIGYKAEGVLPRSAFENNAEAVKPGDSFPVSVTGRGGHGH